MAPSTDEPPAFGQVWSYHGSVPMMLLTSPEPGSWTVVLIYRGWTAVDDGHASGYWTGLYADPDRRIAGWERLDD